VYVSGTDAEFLGRDLHNNKKILIKSWLDLCHENHQGQCLHTQDPDFDKMIRQSYFHLTERQFKAGIGAEIRGAAETKTPPLHFLAIIKTYRTKRLSVN